MSGGERLFRCDDPAVWRGVHAKFWAVVDAKASGKQKSSGKLVELEKWYQEELPAAILARTERSLTHSELLKLMEWKLTRGKFRPRLKQLIGSNSEETVLRCTKQAFALLPDVQLAVAELSTLKGLGPATASAVLAAGAPGEVAFMADEVVESIAELRPVRYTAKHFALFLEKILQKTHRLNKGEGGTSRAVLVEMFLGNVPFLCFTIELTGNLADSQRDWTPHKVELCLWAYAVANQIQPSLLEAFPLSDSTDRETEEEEPREQPSKRRKTE